MQRKTLRDQNEALRDEMVRRDEIVSLLQQGPKTIPEMVEQSGYPSHEVTLWVMAMRRYGMIEELPKSRAEDYFQYKLAEKG